MGLLDKPGVSKKAALQYIDDNVGARIDSALGDTVTTVTTAAQQVAADAKTASDSAQSASTAGPSADAAKASEQAAAASAAVALAATLSFIGNADLDGGVVSETPDAVYNFVGIDGGGA